MRGYLLAFFRGVRVFIFCLCLFLRERLMVLWLFLELITLSLVPAFFLRRGVDVLRALFNYLIVSRVSSSFIVCGVLFDSLLFFCFLGLLVKFGIFPFMGWVYNILLKAGWFVG